MKVQKLKMNYKLLTYLIYLMITVFITVWVGRAFHKNGIHYILSIFKEEKIAHAINNVLLIAYYLVNIGYAITKISTWRSTTNLAELISSLSINLASIFLLLAILNYVNIGVLAIIRYYKSIHHLKH